MHLLYEIKEKFSNFLFFLNEVFNFRWVFKTLIRKRKKKIRKEDENDMPIFMSFNVHEKKKKKKKKFCCCISGSEGTNSIWLNYAGHITMPFDKQLFFIMKKSLKLWKVEIIFNN